MNLVSGGLYRLTRRMFSWNLTFSGKEVELDAGEYLVFLREDYKYPIFTLVFLSPKFDETVECQFLFRDSQGDSLDAKTWFRRICTEEE